MACSILSTTNCVIVRELIFSHALRLICNISCKKVDLGYLGSRINGKQGGPYCHELSFVVYLAQNKQT